MSKQQSPPFDRAGHCRAIASKGGRATYQRYGRRHFQKIGRRGWEQTTRRYFAGSPLLHITWLKTAGLHNYFSSTNLTMKYDVNGRPIWPNEQPTHPAHLVGAGQRGLFELVETAVPYHPLPF